VPSRVRAFVALGSNLGDRRAELERAVERLREAKDVWVERVSSWHETAPVGGPPGQGPYLNGALELSTTRSPRELLALLQSIEREAGRDRSREPRHGPRSLDLDLLMHGDARVAELDLALPHPRMEEREFVLAPLAEIAPAVRLGSGRSASERLAELRARGPDRQAHAPVRTSSNTVSVPDPASAQRWCRAERASGRSLGFVPTMGALHDGHLALVRRSVAENARTCVSVFVNPLQFNDAEDFVRYPRNYDEDVRLLAGAGCDMVFTGSLAQFFPGSARSDREIDERALLDPGPSAVGLEGAFRPGHFRGVATIVARLFECVDPDRAYFGAKDYQQTMVVRDLARRRGRPEIVVCPTEREASGLARSSRNERLSATERERASGIWRALDALRGAWRGGERDADALTARLRDALERGGIAVEYAELRDPERWTAQAPRGELARAIALVAARVGPVRLIDNLRLDRDDGGPAST
jgi:pantoate--beta-alanine ligase